MARTAIEDKGREQTIAPLIPHPWHHLISVHTYLSIDHIPLVGVLSTPLHSTLLFIRPLFNDVYIYYFIAVGNAKLRKKNFLLS